MATAPPIHSAPRGASRFPWPLQSWLLALAHMGFSGSRLVLTLQAAVHLYASPFLLGLLMVVPMLTAVPTGRWADRSGFRAPSLLGVGTFGLAGAIGAAIPYLPALGVTSVLVGSSHMLAHVAVNHAIGVAAPPGPFARFRRDGRRLPDIRPARAAGCGLGHRPCGSRYALRPARDCRLSQR